MKKLFVIFIFSLFTTLAEEPAHTGEMIIDLINEGSSWNVTFLATAITERWDEDYYLTAGYETASVQVPKPGYPLNKVGHFDLIIDVLAGTNPILALGKYKISAIEGGVEKAYFYIDYRTWFNPNHPSVDIYFKYDYTSKHFRNKANTQTIDGTHQTIWDLVEGIERNVSGLELYLNISNQGSNPYLTWNAYHESNILGYNIYKKITLGSGGTNTTVIFTTLSTFLDEDFEIDPKYGEDQVEYWIKARISSSTESLNGNHVQLTGDSFIQWKLANQESKDYQYKLFQNYPNPFNPSTILNYLLKEDAFVNLSIYNPIGKCIVQLVNQQQEKGSYSLEFKAFNLPSGVYFYKLQADSFIDVKKMLLLK